MFASFFGSLLRRSAPAAIDNDPREPACDDAPRTPTNEWKLRSQCDGELVLWNPFARMLVLCHEGLSVGGCVV